MAKRELIKIEATPLGEPTWTAEGEHAFGEICDRICAADDARSLSADGITGYLLVTTYKDRDGISIYENVLTVDGAWYDQNIRARNAARERGKDV